MEDMEGWDQEQHGRFASKRIVLLLFELKMTREQRVGAELAGPLSSYYGDRVKEVMLC